MFRSFKEIEDWILKDESKVTIALAGSDDVDTLRSIVNANEKGIARAILIGDIEKTKELLKQLNANPDVYDYIAESDSIRAAEKAVELVKEKKADLPMKGLIPTATFLRAVLDKEKGLVDKGGLIAQATVYEMKKEARMLVISDCAINISPDYKDKLKITRNAVKLARQLGIEEPKVALVTALETVNPEMQATVDAAMIAKAAERGLLSNCIVDGPLGLDNAISKSAAEHKGISSKVSGQPDVLIMPNIEAGNIFTKSLVYFGDGSPQSGTVTGVRGGIIMTSRSDTAEDKYYSILVAIMQAKKEAAGTI